MDNIFITNASAFKIYRYLLRTYKPINYVRSSVVPPKDIRYKKKHAEKFNIIEKLFSNCKIEVTVCQPNSINNTNYYKCHCYSGKYPKGSFLKVDNAFFISSPELLFCQMAQELAAEKLLMLGFELCGTYSVNTECEDGFIKTIQPITSADKILKYIENMERIGHQFHGIKRARYAAKYILDNSASPRESRLAILLGGPRKIGAFGITGLVLNNPVKLSNAAYSICGQRYVIPDISIPNKKIAIEYDSDAYHNNQNQNRHDKKRIDALQHDG